MAILVLTIHEVATIQFSNVWWTE